MMIRLFTLLLCGNLLSACSGDNTIPKGITLDGCYKSKSSPLLILKNGKAVSKGSDISSYHITNDAHMTLLALRPPLAYDEETNTFVQRKNLPSGNVVITMEEDHPTIIMPWIGLKFEKLDKIPC